MTVLMFQERFAAPILAGTKRQTIRRQRKRRIKVGEDLSLRRWEGVAYRSPQVILLDTACFAMLDVHVACSGIRLGLTNIDWLDEFARMDGFKDWNEMRQWYIVPGVGYGLPFSGILIQWEAVPEKCDLCGRVIEIKPGLGLALKGLCQDCTNNLGGNKHSAPIVRQERRSMTDARK